VPDCVSGCVGFRVQYKVPAVVAGGSAGSSPSTEGVAPNESQALLTSQEPEVEMYVRWPARARQGLHRLAFDL
jgi:hypothetical protein